MTTLREPHELDPVAEANRRAKGKRPHFFDDPAVERVLSITMAVATELAVARERIDTLERLLVQHGVLDSASVERYVPDAQAQAARDAWGREYFARVLRILEQDAQALAHPDAPTEAVMDELGATDSEPDPHPPSTKATPR